jgi:transposase
MTTPSTSSTGSARRHSPLEATSGQNQTRHRLSRGGDRQLTRALYLVAVTKRRCEPTARAYIARRVVEGKTEREAIRCIKRFIARRVWRLLEHRPITT